ncbi:MAG: alpha/beta hydrolase [Gemmatimonadaceae bacterium]|nr:alpha/beta hydrolase [Gemmatimonadaceae bacterium]
MPHPRRRALVSAIRAAALQIALAPAVLHQGARQLAAQDRPAAPRLPVPSVADTSVARAYLRLDLVLRDHAPRDTAASGALHRAFDRATLAFFSGGNARVVAILDSLARATAPTPRDYALADDSAGARLADAPRHVRWLRTATGDSLPWRLFVPRDASGSVEGRGAARTGAARTGAARTGAARADVARPDVAHPRGARRAGAAPVGTSAGDPRPRPLLIAFHGAGASEHTFAIAYGAGELLRVADARDVVVMMPLATPFIRAGAPTVADLARAVAAITPVDTTRVLLLGHSLGGIVASRLAAQWPARVAGVACLASPCPAAPRAATDTMPRVPFLAIPSSFACARARGTRSWSGRRSRARSTGSCATARGDPRGAWHRGGGTAGACRPRSGPHARETDGPRCP